jgi:glycosyltransferase involved in cell wall biosynthesis
MNNYPKITIITPSYNQGNYLEQTITSVLNQNYPNLEYIIIDGGSTDNSVNIIKKYESEISYWISEKDKGQSDAINKGLELATGEIINWLNSDDYYEPDTLHFIADTFLKTNADVVCGKSRLFMDRDITVSFSRGTDVYHKNLAKTIGWARIDQPETFFRKSIIDEIGKLDTRLHYIMDRDWWIKFLFRNGLERIVDTPKCLVNFRLHGTSKTVSHSSKFQVEHDTYFWALAKSFNITAYAEFLEKTFLINHDYKLEANRLTDNLALVKKALDYYLLKRADEYYSMREKLVTKNILQRINVNNLEKEERKLYYKLVFRNKYVPKFLLSSLSRVKKD